MVALNPTLKPTLIYSESVVIWVLSVLKEQMNALKEYNRIKQEFSKRFNRKARLMM